MREMGIIEKIQSRKIEACGMAGWRRKGREGRERGRKRLTHVELVAGEARLAQLGGLGQKPRSPPPGAAGLDHPPPPIYDGRCSLLPPPPLILLLGVGDGVVLVAAAVVVLLLLLPLLLVDATALGCIPVQTGGTRWIVVVRHLSLSLSLCVSPLSSFNLRRCFIIVRWRRMVLLYLPCTLSSLSSTLSPLSLFYLGRNIGT
jgi:hypothetical protein